MTVGRVTMHANQRSGRVSADRLEGVSCQMPETIEGTGNRRENNRMRRQRRENTSIITINLV